MLKIIKSPVQLMNFSIISDQEELKSLLDQEEARICEEEFNKRVQEGVDIQLQEKIVSVRREIDAEFENMKQDVFNSGVEEGKNRGAEIERVKTEPLMDNLQKLVVSLSEEKKNVMLEAEELIIKLAFQIGSKILQKEVEKDDKIIIQIVKGSLKYASEMTEIKLYLNDEDANVIQTHRRELGLNPISSEGLEIIRDSNIERGGCIVETNAGVIDATVSSKLNQIWENLNKGISK